MSLVALGWLPEMIATNCGEELNVLDLPVCGWLTIVYVAVVVLPATRDF